MRKSQKDSAEFSFFLVSHLRIDGWTPDAKSGSPGLHHLMGSRFNIWDTNLYVYMVGHVCIESKLVWVNHSLSCVGPVNGFLCVSHCVQWVLLSPGSILGSSGGGWLRVGAGNWLQTCRQTATLTCKSHREELYKNSALLPDWGY